MKKQGSGGVLTPLWRMSATTPGHIDNIIVIPLNFYALADGILARKQHACRALIQNGYER